MFAAAERVCDGYPIILSFSAAVVSDYKWNKSDILTEIVMHLCSTNFLNKIN